MKNLVKITIISAVLFILSGCATATFQTVKTPKPLKNEITLITKKGDKIKVFEHEGDTKHKSIKDSSIDLAETFYTAAIYGKQQGYAYFAITSQNMNNLSGYPLNSFDNVLEYCNFEKESSKKNYKPRPVCWAEDETGLLDLYSVKLKVQYFKKPIPGLFLYNIDEVISQTEKYL